MSVDPKQGEREYCARIGPAGIAHSLGKPFSDSLCSLRLANLDAIFHLLEDPPGRIVEFGCGVGWLALLLAQRGYAVTGVDIAPEAIAAATAESDKRGLRNADFIVSDYENFSIADKFDCALFYDSLHHAEDEQAALRCAYESLKPNGMLIAFEPGRGHSTTEESLKAVREYDVHEKDMPARYIVRLARAAGFRRHLYLPRPHYYMRRLYRPSYGRVTSGWDLTMRAWLSRLRLTRFLLGPGQDPLVVLWK